MEYVKKLHYYGYIVVITIVTFSTHCLFDLALNLGEDETTVIYDIVGPVGRIVGCILGTVLMKYGRRKMLLVSDIFLLVSALLISLTLNTWAYYMAIVPLAIGDGFGLYAVLLYTREIPLFLQSHLALCLIFMFYLLGYFAGEVFINLCEYYNIVLLKEENLYIVYIGLGISCIPVIAQLILLFTKYKHEPLQYLIEENAVEKAHIAVKDLFRSSTAGQLQIQEMLNKQHASRFHPQTWAHVCSPLYRYHITMSSILVFVIASIGFITFQYAEYKAPNSKVWLFDLTAYVFYIVWLIVSVFYLEALEIWILLTIGTGLAFAFHIVTIVLLVQYPDYPLPYCVSAIMSSLPCFAFLIIPIFKYVLSLMSDKATSFCISAYFMSSFLNLIDLAQESSSNTSSSLHQYDNVILALLIIVAGCAIVGFILAICYIRQYEGLLRYRVTITSALAATGSVQLNTDLDA